MKKIQLERSYMYMLFFDVMVMTANPLLSKKNKSDWKRLRSEINAIYSLIKKAI